MGEVALGRLKATAQDFDRSRYKIARDGMDGYLLQFYLRGQSAMRGSNAEVVGEGDLYVIDMARPLTTSTSDHDQISLVVPRRLKAERLNGPDSVHMRVVPAGLPLVALALRSPEWRHLTISEIGSAHGFANAENFSRAFRREYGLSPREVRQLAATGAACPRRPAPCRKPNGPTGSAGPAVETALSLARTVDTGCGMRGTQRPFPGRYVVSHRNPPHHMRWMSVPRRSGSSSRLNRRQATFFTGFQAFRISPKNGNFELRQTRPVQPPRFFVRPCRRPPIRTAAGSCRRRLA